MKLATLGPAMLLISIFSQGCSVFMAGNQPPKVDLDSIESGQGSLSRDMVISKLGIPTSSVKNQDGTRSDIYEFYEGSATGWKIGRATFNALADIATLGLWEIVATPTEILVKGDKITARGDFDHREILTKFVILTADKQKKKEQPAPLETEAAR